MGSLPIIDRRSQGGKSAGNVERFHRRYAKHIDAQVKRTFEGDRSLTDKSGVEVFIPGSDITTPTFHHAAGGTRDIVHPGNKEFVKGDKIPRRQNPQQRQGDEDLTFVLTHQQYLKHLFDGLELRDFDLVSASGDHILKPRRAGFSATSNPSGIDVNRTFKASLSRRIPAKMIFARQAEAIQAEIDELSEILPPDFERALRLNELFTRLGKLKNHHVPYMLEMDLRKRKPADPIKEPQKKAVMYLMMDVSASMSRERRLIAKKLFQLLQYFVDQHYDAVDLIFIRHTDQAKISTEKEFYESMDTGGTVASTAFKAMHEHMLANYSDKNVNIYGFYAGDGDNWVNDNAEAREAVENLLGYSKVRGINYAEVVKQEEALWRVMESIARRNPSLARKLILMRVPDQSSVIPEFRKAYRMEPKSKAHHSPAAAVA